MAAELRCDFSSCVQPSVVLGEANPAALSSILCLHHGRARRAAASHYPSAWPGQRRPAPVLTGTPIHPPSPGMC